MAELLIGAGSSRVKKLVYAGRSEWDGLVTLDMNPDHKPDVVFDLNYPALPFPDDTFSEIHAYDTLEHLGTLGDWRFFFAQWSDFWRVLKPDGVFLGISPHISSPWAFGDPGHTRVITSESFTFLHQPSYAAVGSTAITDYRFCYKADFNLIHCAVDEVAQMHFVLQAVKPSRIIL